MRTLVFAPVVALLSAGLAACYTQPEPAQTQTIVQPAQTTTTVYQPAPQPAPMAAPQTTTVYVGSAQPQPMVAPAQPGVGATMGVQAGPVSASAGFSVQIPQPISAPMPPIALNQLVGPVAGVAAQPGQLWVDGHFNFLSGAYQWLPGHYEAAPQQGVVWQQPAWQSGQFYPGFWRPQTMQAPPAYSAVGPWNPGGVVNAGMGLLQGATQMMQPR
ncbi:MAG: hypothetical protein JNK72_04795 [Myxococcales bacterium]|nr:hypothetical protein [Myxococcales bacterium]